MNVNIVKGNSMHVSDCIQILQNSEIGRVYFSDHSKVESLLLNAISENGLYIAVNDHAECLGFIYYMSKGVFGSYPYLHIIVVKEEYRGHGIGRQLMSYFEENASVYLSTKYFLTVDDFNTRAKALYECLGYQCVGVLPDFYKEGIDSHLMMKVINRS